MSQYTAGSRLIWTSNSRRRRKVEIVLWLQTMGLYIVRVLEGAPAEKGSFRRVPPSRLEREAP